MQNAVIRSIPTLIDVGFPQGAEIIPTTINGKRVQYVSIDASGSIVAWAAPTPPRFSQDVWQLDCDDLLEVGFVGGAESDYQHADASLRQITVEALLAA